MIRISHALALGSLLSGFAVNAVRADENFCATCPGDLDGSGFVTLDDLPLFVDALISGATDLCADVNGDALIDGRDIRPMIDRCLSDSEAGFACSAAQSAQYRVTFHSTWSAATHPVDYPATAHYSSLIGGTHNASVSFWDVGGLATLGIERMAENGQSTPLRNEVEAQIAQGRAGMVIAGPGLGTTPASASTTFIATQQFPLATVVTMVAPSPDWFVGVSGTPLFENGQWLDQVVISVQPMDSGTDSGVTYTSPDFDTQPRELIHEITYAPLEFNGSVAPMGTFTFTRLN